MEDNKTRCDWVPEGDDLYTEYHDKEWGVPIHDDNTLFEFLILEGAQAGLSWRTILARRNGYRKAYEGFDPDKVAHFDEKKRDSLRKNADIIRNKLKIHSSVTNAKVFLIIQKENQSFNNYLWGFVNRKPIKNQYKSAKDIPVRTELSDRISNDLKKRGMSFVGSTIIYAYLQAVGIINDHTLNCFRRQEISNA